MLIPILAQAAADAPGNNSDIITWGIILTLTTIASNVVAVIVAFKKQKTEITSQPISVEVVKALHEQFADKGEFLKLKDHTTARHGQLFDSIDKLERAARAELLAQIAIIQSERQRSLEKLDQRNERYMFALGKIAAKLNVDIEP